MAEWFKSHGKSLLHGWLGGLTWWLTTIVVSSVSSYYAAHSALIDGLPAYKAIPIGCATFAVIAFGFYLLALAKAKWFVKSDVAAQSTECPDKWLHELAEEQQRDIDAWAYCDTCSLGSHDLLRSSPYIDFRFTIHNSSAFILSIGGLSGTVSFANTPIDGKIDWIKAPPDKIYPGAGRPSLENDCVARLTLNDKQDAARILNIRGGFGFGHLVAKITATQTSVEPRNIRFNCGIDNRELSDDGNYKRLEIEIQEYQLWKYWKWRASDSPYGGFPDKPVGSIVNLKVRFINRRDGQVEIASFKLDTSSPSFTRRTTAATGEIFEQPRTGFLGKQPYRGIALEPNLNECPLQAEQGTPQEGWVQFIVLDVEATELQGTTPSMIAIDSLGVEHRVGCSALVLNPR